MDFFLRCQNILHWRWVPGTLQWKDLEGVWAPQETVFWLIRDFGRGQRRLDWVPGICLVWSKWYAISWLRNLALFCRTTQYLGWGWKQYKCSLKSLPFLHTWIYATSALLGSSFPTLDEVHLYCEGICRRSNSASQHAELQVECGSPVRGCRYFCKCVNMAELCEGNSFAMKRFIYRADDTF